MLINTLSLLFTFTDYLTELQALVIVIAAGLLVDWLTPRPSEYWQLNQSQSVYYYLQASWLGQLELKDAFWPFFIVFNAALVYIDYRIEEGTFTVASWVTVHIILAMPLVYWTGAVWRCSDQTTRKFWSSLARLITLLAWAEFWLRWVILDQYPQIFFNCQQMITQWGDC